MEHPQLPSEFNFSVSPNTFYAFINAYPNGVIFINAEQRILHLNSQLLNLSGFKVNELKGRPLRILFPEDANVGKYNPEEIFNGAGKVIAGQNDEYTLQTKDGLLISVTMSYNCISENDSSLYFCLLEDISHRKLLQEKLYQQAITDPLTGLFNRRQFDKNIRKEFKRANRYGRPFSSVIIDIDGFKQANDLHGHAYGDEMLIRATKIYQDILRNEDSVYRYGGDEFAMILPETAKEGAIELASRLKDEFVKKCVDRDKRIKLSLSIGIASYPEDGTDEKGLIGAADRRMYHSKESGGNLLTAYDDIKGLDDDAGLLLRVLSNMASLVEKNRGFSSMEGVSHSQNIRVLSIELGYKINLPSSRLTLLEQASILHDIGTMYIPNSILKKQTKLTDEEWEDIKKHTSIGEEIIDMITPDSEGHLVELKQIVGQHHERLDGTGYPRGLLKDEIILEAKILAIADAYIAMTSERPYRKAMSKAEALSELKKYSGIWFDETIVEALCEYIN